MFYAKHIPTFIKNRHQKPICAWANECWTSLYISAEYYTEVKEIIRIQLAAPLSLLIPDLVNIRVIDDDESDQPLSCLERDFFFYERDKA